VVDNVDSNPQHDQPRRDSELLRLVPSVNQVLQQPDVQPLVDEAGRRVVVGWVREELEAVRRRLLEQNPDPAGVERDELLEETLRRLHQRAAREKRRRLVGVVNATGVVLHTGLGRASLSAAARSALAELAGACNVEVDLETGERKYRGYQLRAAWQVLTGAEDVLVVNNNAAATLLTLQVLCAGREVLISRGQLIEIGGSFRLPEIFELSGAVLREVGTTNRTRLSDYERAVGPETAAILHVHTSNYRIVGFCQSVPVEDLVRLGRRHQLLVVDDIGSGAVVDVTQWGLPEEPSFARSLAAGADLVLGSGDKLLGGPQCGIISGRAELVERLRSHPLARAVRVDKLTLAALSATLDSYLRGTARDEVPVLRMLTASLDELRRRAEKIVAEAGDCSPLQLQIQTDTALAGGGTLPGVELPTAVICVKDPRRSAQHLAQALRCGTIPVFPRVREDQVLLDLRSVLPDDDSRLALALRLAARAGQAAGQHQ